MQKGKFSKPLAFLIEMCYNIFCSDMIRLILRRVIEELAFCSAWKACKFRGLFDLKIKYFVVLSVSSFQFFLEEMRNYIYGELSEWSKVQHSKCCVPKRNLGFESLTLRQKSTVILIELRWTFSMPENRLKSGFSAVSAHKRPRCRAILRRGFMRFVMIAAFCTAVIVKQPSNRWTTGGNR